MVSNIPTIQPFTYQASTAFQERVQLANKLNEVIDALNNLGDLPDLENQITELTAKVTELEDSIGNTDTSLAELENQVNTIVSEVNGLLKEVVSEVVLDAPEYGQVRVKVIHENDTETASNALQIPVIVDGGISLISGTTARSFKIRYITADGVTHTTNDFVIPEGGGGTDVTVTSVTILEGDTDNSFKFEIGLSDGSSIQSNSYPFPAASELTPATATQLGGVKIGAGIIVQGDGTISVDKTQIDTAAVASAVMFTADASKVTFHADSVGGSEFTKDIPQASQGGAGTIDQESYAKIAATESKVNALAPTVTVNGDVSPAQITVAINGKSSTANLPGGGSDGWEVIDLDNIPTDFTVGDEVEFIIGVSLTRAFAGPDSWNESFSGAIELRSWPELPRIAKITIPPGYGGNIAANVATRIDDNFIEIYSINSVDGVDNWNTQTANLFNLTAVLFNGSGISSVSYNINRSNIKTYVNSMKRKRA